MTLLHTMSFAGSVSVIIYMMLYGLTKRYLTVLWHKIYLTVAIFIYIIPFAFFSPEYLSLIRRLVGMGEKYVPGELIDISYRTIWVFNDGIYASNMWLYVFIAICLVLCVSYIVIMFVRYYRLHKAIMDISEIKNINNSKIYMCEILDTPLTMGVIHPKIIIPKNSLKDYELNMVLKHEYMHVKMYDNLIKVFITVCVILNFYNPLVYYLIYQWNKITEMYCDEQTIKGKSKGDINIYANMIIDYATCKREKGLPIMGLSLNNRQLKERIKNMKKEKRNYGVVSKIIGTLVIIMSVFFSSLTSFAYEDRGVFYIDEDKEIGESKTFFIIGDGAYVEFDKEYEDIEKYINGDICIYFVDNNDNVYYYDNNESNIQYTVCIHTYIDGNIVRHLKNSTGGCTVEIYYGKTCSKCKNCVIGEIINSKTYMKCPH